jgi:hypothetical protein
MFFQKMHPKKGFVYAVTTGTYAGQLFVYIEPSKTEQTYNFLALPEMITRSVPKEKFDFGLRNKIIDVVERLPGDIYSTCILQYKKNTKKLVNSS